MRQYIENAKKVFVGKSITKVSRKNMSEVIVTLDSDEKMLVSVAGDCCSSSIFYEIVFPDELKGKTITNVICGSTYSWQDEVNEDKGAESEDVAFKKAKKIDPEFYRDHLSVWDVVFKTAQGDIRIRHINTSNGYYDGDVMFEGIES